MTDNYKDSLRMDVENIEPMNLSNSKKLEMKQNILAQSHKKKNFMKLRHLTAAAIIIASVVTATSYTFPTFAAQIPFMKNVIGYFDNENTIYENYNVLATEIGQTQSSNGTSVMIENAIFDGTSLTVTYAIETDADFGPSVYMSNSLEIKGASGFGGSGTIQKISDTKYIGLEKITPFFDKNIPDELEVTWQPKSFIDELNKTEVKGDWDFNFTISRLDNNVQLVNQSITNNGVTVLVESLEKNDLSTVIKFEAVVEEEILKQWPFVSVQFDTVKDDLGNTYIVDGNGGSSHDNGVTYKSSDTIKALNPNAKSLILTPIAYFSIGSGKGLEAKEMDSITIDLE